MKMHNAIAYEGLYKRLKDRPLAIKLAYKLNKLHNKISGEIIFYEETLQKYLTKYAQYNEDGSIAQNSDKTGILIQSEYLKECYEKINELLSIEIGITEIVFTLDELDELKITPAELSCIQDLITE